MFPERAIASLEPGRELIIPWHFLLLLLVGGKSSGDSRSHHHHHEAQEREEREEEEIEDHFGERSAEASSSVRLLNGRGGC